jgi:hypothetical protein
VQFLTLRVIDQIKHGTVAPIARGADTAAGFVEHQVDRLTRLQQLRSMKDKYGAEGLAHMFKVEEAKKTGVAL